MVIDEPYTVEKDIVMQQELLLRRYQNLKTKASPSSPRPLVERIADDQARQNTNNDYQRDCETNHKQNTDSSYHRLSKAEQVAEFSLDDSFVEEQKRIYEAIQCRVALERAATYKEENSNIPNKKAHQEDNGRVDFTPHFDDAMDLKERPKVAVPDPSSSRVRGKTSAASGDRIKVLNNGTKLRIKGVNHVRVSIAKGRPVSTIMCPMCRSVLRVDLTIRNVYCVVCGNIFPLELAKNVKS